MLYAASRPDLRKVSWLTRIWTPPPVKQQHGESLQLKHDTAGRTAETENRLPIYRRPCCTGRGRRRCGTKMRTARLSARLLDRHAAACADRVVAWHTPGAQPTLVLAAGRLRKN